MAPYNQVVSSSNNNSSSLVGTRAAIVAAPLLGERTKNPNKRSSSSVTPMFQMTNYGRKSSKKQAGGGGRRNPSVKPLKRNVVYFKQYEDSLINNSFNSARTLKAKIGNVAAPANNTVVLTVVYLIPEVEGDPSTTIVNQLISSSAIPAGPPNLIFYVHSSEGEEDLQHILFDTGFRTIGSNMPNLTNISLSYFSSAMDIYLMQVLLHYLLLLILLYDNN